MIRLKDLRIIVVVETDALRKVVDLLLEQIGVERLFLNEVAELENVIRDGEKNVLLVPSALPDGGSWKLTGFLRQSIDPLPFFVYTSHFDFTEWAGVLDAGGLDLLVLPFNAEQLRSALSRALIETPWNDRDR